MWFYIEKYSVIIEVHRIESNKNPVVYNKRNSFSEWVTIDGLVREGEGDLLIDWLIYRDR